MKLITYTDGGSRGNPGPAASGVYIITGEGKEVIRFGKTLGIATNNVAEYTAIIEAFSWILLHKEEFPNLRLIESRMDSQLASRQLSGVYKVKHPVIQELFYQVQKLIQKLNVPLVYQHVPREQNKIADREVNLALDNESTQSIQ